MNIVWYYPIWSKIKPEDRLNIMYSLLRKDYIYVVYPDTRSYYDSVQNYMKQIFLWEHSDYMLLKSKYVKLQNEFIEKSKELSLYKKKYGSL